jgi:hypothetical protein
MAVGATRVLRSLLLPTLAQRAMGLTMVVIFVALYR